ncbi:hypothetical protein ACVIRO_001279 [Rhizobium ruizarguesonis]
MGHTPNPRFDNEADAFARYREEIAIPSYINPSRMRSASVIRVRTLTKDVTPK